MKSKKIISTLIALLLLFSYVKARTISFPVIKNTEVKQTKDPQEMKAFLSGNKKSEPVISVLLTDRNLREQLIETAGTLTASPLQKNYASAKRAKAVDIDNLLSMIKPLNVKSGVQSQSFSTDTTFVTNGYKYEYNYDGAGNTVFKVYAKDFGDNPNKPHDWGLIYHSVIPKYGGAEKVIYHISKPATNIFECYKIDDGVLTVTNWTVVQNYRVYNKYLNDGKIISSDVYYWDPCSGGDEPQNKISFIYTNNKLSRIMETNKNNQPLSKIEIGYDPSTGFMSYASTYFWDNQLNRWIPNDKDEWYYKSGTPSQDKWSVRINFYSYNPSGIPTGQYFWLNGWKEVITYNQYWLPVNIKHYVWTPGISIWSGTWNDGYGYTLNGIPVSNLVAKNPVGISAGKASTNETSPLLSYVQRTACDTSKIKIPDDTLTVQWDNVRKEENRYDTYGNLLSNTKSSWNNAQWQTTAKSVNTFDYTSSAAGTPYPANMTYTHKLLKTSFYDAANQEIDNLTYQYNTNFLTTGSEQVNLVDSLGTFGTDTIKANVIWTYSGGADWLTVTPVPLQKADSTLMGLADNQYIGNAALRFKATPNSTSDSRSCIITLTPVYGSPRQINVIQPVVTALRQVKYPSLEITPNPATTYFTIQGIEKETALTVYDIHGKIVLEKRVFPDEKAEVRSWNKGIYFVKTENGTGKLIIR